MDVQTKKRKVTIAHVAMSNGELNAIDQIAREENRSRANTIHTLLREAIESRQGQREEKEQSQ
jgi:hypothetical protein